jgi:hypothetical protein
MDHVANIQMQRTSESVTPHYVDEQISRAIEDGKCVAVWFNIEANVHFWVLRLRNRSAVTLPTKDVDADALAFVEASIRGGGRAV